MSLPLKFTSLAIRTFSKPIANFIKRQAREHEGFRQTCISFAQTLHRIDMRWRIGLLQDAAAVERQASKEAADAAKKHKQSVPTVKTEAQAKAEEEAAAKAGKQSSESAKPRSQPKIRPLSEAKAVESGATFISETFLFSVAAGLIFFESWRSRRRETSRREDVADRLNDLEESEKAARRALIELEREVIQLRAGENPVTMDMTKRILPSRLQTIDETEENQSDELSRSWFSRIASYITTRGYSNEEEKSSGPAGSPGPAEKILVESDIALDEKHKLQAVEATGNVTSGNKDS